MNLTDLTASCRSLLTTAATLTLLGVAAIAQGTGTHPDDGARWEPFFGPSGAIAITSTVRLDGGQPPLLGGTSTIHVVAPGFQFAFVGISGNATTGFWIPLDHDPLAIYLDPLQLLGSLPLPLGGGMGQLPLPLPPDPTLSGLELALQAVTLDAANRVGASNLLAGNFGTTIGGGALFAFQFGPVSVNPSSYWPDNQNRTPIATNATNAAKQYSIQGVRAQNGGTLELRDQNGTVIATVGPNTPAFHLTVTVPAGGKLYWYNSSGAMTVNGVTWQVAVD